MTLENYCCHITPPQHPYTDLTFSSTVSFILTLNFIKTLQNPTINKICKFAANIRLFFRNQPITCALKHGETCIEFPLRFYPNIAEISTMFLENKAQKLKTSNNGQVATRAWHSFSIKLLLGTCLAMGLPHRFPPISRIEQACTNCDLDSSQLKMNAICGK